MTRKGCEGCGAHPDRRAFVQQLINVSGLFFLPGAVRISDDTIEYPIPDAEGAIIDRANDVVLMRWKQTIYAFSLACPHQNTALRWRGDQARFQCPKHNSRYEPDGSFISGRATRGMDRFAVSRKADRIVVHLTELFSEKDDPEKWRSALLRL